MKPHRFSKCLAALVLAAAVTAQVPRNHVIVSTIPNGTGPSGLFFVSLETGKITRVTGLPAFFTRTTSNSAEGAISVVRRPSDEAIFVGNRAISGNSTNDKLYVTQFTLSKNKAVKTRQILLGSPPKGYWHGFQMRLMADGRRLLVGTKIDTVGPMNGSQLAIVDPDATPPTVTPIKLKAPLKGNYIGALAASGDGQTVYAVTNMGQPNKRPHRLYQIDIKTKASTLLYVDNTRQLGFSPSVRGRDVLYAWAKDHWGFPKPKPTDILQIRMTGWGKANMTMTRRALDKVEACAGSFLDLTTGKRVMASNGFEYVSTPNPYSLFLADEKTGTTSLLTKPPTGGWGAISYIAMHGLLEEQGRTPQEHQVSFRTYPNPGGIPQAGNANFSLTLETTVPSAPALLLFGVTPIHVPVLGTNLLVNPLVIRPYAPPAPGRPVTFWMPIPSSIPSGSTVFAQLAMCAAGSCHASRRLRITTK